MLVRLRRGSSRWLSVGEDLVLIAVAVVLLFAGLVIVADAIIGLFGALTTSSIAQTPSTSRRAPCWP